MTRHRKSDYKYYLHLNGHEGSRFNGAYSSALKWGLMNKSVVFYSAPDYFREFWQHSRIMNEVFIFSKTPSELLNQYDYVTRNPEFANNVATSSFEFFKKYLMNYDNIMYYMQKLLNEYSNRMNYKTVLNDNDVEILVTYHSPYFDN
jgi:hypothetical protein